MQANIIELVKLGKIPNNGDLSDEMFNVYDILLQNVDCLTFEEAESIIGLFSDDCDDLNWGLLHMIESIDFDDVERYRLLISKCNNREFREILEIRLKNTLVK